VDEPRGRPFGAYRAIMGTVPGTPRLGDPRSRRTTISDAAIPQPSDDGLVGDRAIVEAVLAGDRDAFRRLVERESVGVVRACHRVLGDLHAAEDAAQEAFVTAYRSLSTWRGDGPFGAWLTRIAVRIALREAGKRKTIRWRDTGAAGAEAADPVSRAMDRASVEASATMDPSSLVVRAEGATDVRAALASLSEPYREVVTLRFFGELSLEEIAVETGRPLGTVKTHLHRGLLRLRDSMAQGGAR
jgi:RNA polymerase sigma-70 factor (ECF subfamily)